MLRRDSLMCFNIYLMTMELCGTEERVAVYWASVSRTVEIINVQISIPMLCCTLDVGDVALSVTQKRGKRLIKSEKQSYGVN